MAWLSVTGTLRFSDATSSTRAAPAADGAPALGSRIGGRGRVAPHRSGQQHCQQKALETGAINDSNLQIM